MNVFWSKPFPPHATFSAHPFMPNASSPFSSPQTLVPLSIPRGIEESGIGQGGSPDFLAGGGVPEDASSLGCRKRGIAASQDPKRGRKIWGKADAGQNRLFYHERYTPQPISICNHRFLPDKKNWTLMVQKALEQIDKGHLEKVVLARVAIYECREPPDPFALAASLCSGGATVFCFSTRDQAFLGATPELLFSRQNNRIETVAMAGTRKRGNTPRADQKLEQELLQSPKDLHEWSFIPRHFQTTLSPLSTALTFSPLRVYKTPTVQHLYSRCRATLKNALSDAEILQRLHPTPALCGTPTDAALSLIRELEPFDRGLYAGAIGWKTPEASEYHAAIRSCFISGNTLHLYSAAGIVKGSSADAEWEELNQKLRLYESLFC